VKLHTISIAQDLGQSLEIESGIAPTDRVIINPSDSVADGDKVQVTAPQKAAPANAASSSNKGVS
jgi:hypothetical protein